MTKFSYELVVFVIVVSVLDVVSAHDFDLSHASILFPVEEVMPVLRQRANKGLEIVSVACSWHLRNGYVEVLTS